MKCPSAVAPVVFCALAPLSALAQSTERISVDALGVEGDDVSVGASISADGRFVAFQSAATNLVASDTNGLEDIFVRDRTTGVVMRVSVHSFGSQATGGSSSAVISADGRCVAFDSLAPNLVAADTNNRRDVFVYDRPTATTQRVSIDSTGLESDGVSSAPAISADGRFVAFQSRGTNLVAGDANGVSDVFLHDRLLGVTTRVSVDSAGLEANGASDSASITGAGDMIVFRSVATNLVALDTNLRSDIFLRNPLANATVRVSVSTSGVQADGDSLLPEISSNGSTVVFESEATNLVASDANGLSDVFRRDLLGATTARVSVDSSGAEASGPSVYAAVNADGSRVAFHSLASNLVAGDANATWDVFVHDAPAGTTRRVSVDSSGAESDGSSGLAALAGNGRFVVFSSNATNLVAGDLNLVNDVFLRDLCDPVWMSYCTAGTTANGCNAVMSATGTPSASAASAFVIHVDDVEGQKTGLVFYGTSGRLELPWGAGSSFRCVQIPIQRTPQQATGGAAGACDGSMQVDWNAYLASHPNALGVPFAAGMIVDAQAWFRDPPSPLSTSMSNALEFCVGL